MKSEIKEEAIEQLKKDVLFGFEDDSELFEGIREMFYDEEHFDEKWLKEEISRRLKEHLKESKHWDSPTDFNKLVKVFDQLVNEKIVSLHKAGYTRQDGEDDCLEIIEELKLIGVEAKGYCYYHTQDLERAIQKDGGLLIGFGSFNQNDKLTKKIAERIVELLEQNNFSIEWSGSIDTRINITTIDWKKIPDEIDYNYGRVFEILGKKKISDQVKKKEKPFWKFW